MFILFAATEGVLFRDKGGWMSNGARGDKTYSYIITENRGEYIIWIEQIMRPK